MEIWTATSNLTRLVGGKPNANSSSFYACCTTSTRDQNKNWKTFWSRSKRRSSRNICSTFWNNSQMPLSSYQSRFSQSKNLLSHNNRKQIKTRSKFNIRLEVKIAFRGSKTTLTRVKILKIRALLASSIQSNHKVMILWTLRCFFTMVLFWNFWKTKKTWT